MSRALASVALLIALVACGEATVSAQSLVATIHEGNAAYRAGRYGEAAAAYQRALADAPTSPVARTNLGMTLLRAGHPQAAIDALASARDHLTDPAHRATALYALGTALAAVGRLEEALAALRASLRLRDDQDVRFDYAVVWRWQQAQQGEQQAPPLPEPRARDLRDKARPLDVPILPRLSDRPSAGPDR